MDLSFEVMLSEVSRNQDQKCQNYSFLAKAATFADFMLWVARGNSASIGPVNQSLRKALIRIFQQGEGI